MFPDAAPAEVGWKATVIVVCCPAFTFRGSVNPLTVKAAPVSVTCVMLNGAVPVLVTIRTCDELLPTTTLPKLMELELTWMPGVGVGFTVSVAAALVTVPAVLLTTTRNVEPLSAVVVADVV
jgi:pantoate kinase